jgi:general nucleoside transport system ATP-binding protein
MNSRVLSMQGITKRFGRLVANDDISIDLARGEVLALLGENGAGKSTLMSILFGHYVADEGIVTVFEQILPPGDTQAALRAGVGMVHQHFALAENLSVLDNVLIGMDSLWKLRLSSAAMRQKLLDTASAFGLDVDPDAVVRSLSMGGRQRVEILKALTRGAKILILDEPTAILTPQESESLFTTLKGFVDKGLSIIFISHKLNEVLRVSDRVAVLRGGRLVAERVAAAASTAELAELMVGKEVDLLGAMGSDDARSKDRQHQRLLELSANPATLELRGLTSREVRDVSFTIRAGEIFGIAGVSGNGQSELADVLCGVLAPMSGQALLSGKAYPLGAHQAKAAIDAGIARIPEDRTQRGVVGDASLTENVFVGRHRSSHLGHLGRFGLLNHRARHEGSKLIADQFDIRHAGLENPTRSLSGGNIQKLVLGRELGLTPGSISLVIANQPTWGLDVGAVAYVHEQLCLACANGAAVLLISDELDEIFALADTVAVMFKGELSSPKPACEWTRAEIGLEMAGVGRAKAEDAHAA